jgi:hypothetical protein
MRAPDAANRPPRRPPPAKSADAAGFGSAGAGNHGQGRGASQGAKNRRYRDQPQVMLLENASQDIDHVGVYGRDGVKTGLKTTVSNWESARFYGIKATP